MREFHFSRRFGKIIAFSILPLSLLGFWLTFTGTLRESEEHYQSRRKLASENKTLTGAVSDLDGQMTELQLQLNRLEEHKINALMLTGIEYMEQEENTSENRLFSFFQNLAPMQLDIAQSLKKAVAVSSYLDSTIDLLSRENSVIRSLPTAFPVSSEAIVTRNFGHVPDPFTGRKGMHAGMDFSHFLGADVSAAGGGTVSTVSNDRLWGNCIRIIHGNRVETFYAHLDAIRVKRGQAVERGQVIGTIGSSGKSIGPHLHYELIIGGEKVDPAHYFLPDLRLRLSDTVFAQERL